MSSSNVDLTADSLADSFYYALSLFCFSLLCLLTFGVLVHFRVAAIAPRTRNRPKETMVFGNLVPPQSKSGPGSPSSLSLFMRGCVGWIPHVLGLSYDDMLTGVEGTGSRDVTGGGRDAKLGVDGLAEEGMAPSSSSPREGTLLQVNLDSIVIDRFHEMCLKMTFWIMLVSLSVALPLNYTGGCYTNDLAFLGSDIPYESVCPQNMTQYLRTTIANVPTKPDFDDGTSFLHSRFRQLWGRSFGLVVVVWIITYIVCHILKKEVSRQERPDA